MTFNLKNRPRKFALVTNKELEEWFEGFEKRHHEIENDPEKWLDENEALIAEECDYGTDYSQITFEDVIQFFVKKEILGVDSEKKE